MATISLLSRLVNGVQRQVNLSSNTLWVQDIQLNNSSGYTLAGTTSGHAGSSLIGDDNSYTNFTPASATIKGALSGIDSAIGSLTGYANTALSNLVTTSINQSLLPASTSGAQVLGSATHYWGQSFISQIADTSGTSSILFFTRTAYDSSGASAIAWNTRHLNDASGNTSQDWANRYLYDSTPNISIDYQNRLLKDSAGHSAVDYQNRELFDNNTSPAVQLSWSTSGVEFNQLTASTVPYLNSSKVLTSSSVTPTQLGYLSGATGTTGTGALVLANAPTFAGNVNLGGFLINNLGTPSASTDAATKGYVDSAINGLTWKGPVQAYAASNVPLTGGTTLTIDGYSVSNGDYIILGNQTTATQNYVYVVSGIGSSYTLTEVTNSEAPTAIGDAYLVEKGTVYGSSAFQVNAISPNVTFIQFAGPNTYTFNAPLSSTGNVVSFLYGNGLALSSSHLVVESADSSILVASGGISVVEDPAGAIVTGGSGIKAQVLSTGGIQITSNSLALLIPTVSALSTSSTGLTVNVSATGGIQISGSANGSLSLLLASNSALATSSSGVTVQTDNSTVGVNGSNQLYVPNTGITKTQLNLNVFDQATITGGAGTTASVVYAPAIEWSGVAGQTFTSNKTYAVRYGIASNGETAGRLYAADITTSSFDLFWVVGFIQTGASSVSAGGTVQVIQVGTITLASGDGAFGSTDSGKPIFLQSGGINATTTPPSTTGQAVAKIGIVISTTSFLAQIGAPYVY